MANKLLISFIFFHLMAFGQEKCLVYLKDKGTNTLADVTFTKQAIQRRLKHDIKANFTDIPLYAEYLHTLERHGCIKGKSKWLNAIILDDVMNLTHLRSLPFIDSMAVLYKKDEELISKHKATASVHELDYGANLENYEMMDIPLMHRLGYRGKGVKIAVFDSGFDKVDVLDFYENTSILGTYDFVNNDSTVYEIDLHGTYVFSVLAADKGGDLIGTAIDADYYLFITEDIATESREEEFNWTEAAEKADSLGVDIISSSLGYNLFDNAAENYAYEDLDGKTAIITQAAALAARKGILVVNSAGNEGNNAWYYVNPPADADSVLVVGSVNMNGDYVSFSSKGPTFDGRIKPDVVCQGVGVYVTNTNGNVIPTSGTSFSVPQVTGLCAGVLSMDSSYTNMEVISLVKQSANRYNTPDNQYGYGVPGFARLLNKVFNGGGKGIFLREVAIYTNVVQDESLRVFVESDRDINEWAKIQIQHASGAVMYSEEFKVEGVITTLPVDISNYSSGLYIIKVVLPSGGEYVHKMIKH